MSKTCQPGVFDGTNCLLEVLAFEHVARYDGVCGCFSWFCEMRINGTIKRFWQFVHLAHQRLGAVNTVSPVLAYSCHNYNFGMREVEDDMFHSFMDPKEE
jgi:hypothetical protein